MSEVIKEYQEGDIIEVTFTTKLPAECTEDEIDTWLEKRLNGDEYFYNNDDIAPYGFDAKEIDFREYHE